MQIALYANIREPFSAFRSTGEADRQLDKFLANPTAMGIFIKKTQKTPSAELRLALKRQHEMLDEQKDY
ncbi:MULTISPECIES: hypothetical protein [Enterobacter cloacae complex]|uniref:hypothetical protein n=1 Tax=Enterobacter cloacae complex TaxID=354276 RepID=UPI0004AD5FED|nr:MULTISPECIES: hypothetical protein [Enterobacter cloacae complex]BCZ54061.1 hypothetical protein SL264_34670 [Enterobacter cloacae]BCZ63690.1 hypothetical protein SL269_34740 [Klebsiella aerogenes]MCL8123078.1 type II toxin-antitoxin system RelE/ParE family toxin [Enterobacter hormaechei]MCM7006169.1 type II toxin-antitoxin system RelE/ParE family toxin [Enterobacter hormaechei]MCM7099176.1 type II toxin-antitoxin system RelE/ParE family toxin [Enterobacter hormaechei]